MEDATTTILKTFASFDILFLDQSINVMVSIHIENRRDPYSELLFTIFVWFVCLSVHVVLVVFVFLVYTSSSELGSPSVVYDRLRDVVAKSRICTEPLSHHDQACGSVNGNYKGSYLTMLSSGGAVFGLINIVGNFGTVFVDNVRFLFQWRILV